MTELHDLTYEISARKIIILPNPLNPTLAILP